MRAIPKLTRNDPTEAKVWLSSQATQTAYAVRFVTNDSGQTIPEDDRPWLRYGPELDGTIVYPNKRNATIAAEYETIQTGRVCEAAIYFLAFANLEDFATHYENTSGLRRCGVLWRGKLCVAVYRSAGGIIDLVSVYDEQTGERFTVSETESEKIEHMVAMALRDDAEADLAEQVQQEVSDED